MLNSQIINLVLSIVWSAYMILEGYREAYYWSAVVKCSTCNFANIHKQFLIQRAIVYIAFCYISKEWLMMLSIFIISPFFHNGMYYTIRNKIDHCYPKRWLDQSVNSTAWSTIYLTPVVRVTLFIIGLGLIAYYFLIN